MYAIYFYMSTDHSAPSVALSNQLVVLAMLALVLYGILSIHSQHSHDTRGPPPLSRMNYTKYKLRPRRYERLRPKEVPGDIYLGIGGQLVAGQDCGRDLINGNPLVFP